MKYIFDFDDVLFNNTMQFKEHMYQCLEDVGVSRQIAQKYYKEAREKGFTLAYFISSLLDGDKINKIDKEELYEKIMIESKNFINTKLLELIRKIGESNCYIVTHGVREYQLEKIKRTGIASLFSEIIVVQNSKKESIEKICAKHSDERIIFIDDKEKHFESLNLKKYPNLKTILYTGQDLSPYLQ